jgi:hypothetical protein
MKKVRIEVRQEHYEQALAYQRTPRGEVSPYGCLLAQALRGNGISFVAVGYKTIVIRGGVISFLSRRVEKIVRDFESDNHFVFKPFYFYITIPTHPQITLEL